MVSMTRLSRSKAYDLAAAAPLIVWYGVGIWERVPHIAQQCAALWSTFAAGPALEVASETATLGFLGLQIVLFLIRRVPQAKAPGLLPRLAAVVGGNIQLLFLALPQAHLPLPLTALSAALITGGMVGAAYVGFWLGRSFSIFPQARRLVVRGPYRLLRHPLYLVEQIATLGVVMQYAQPWSLLIGAASLISQFPRMYYEERVLAKTYPEYGAYAARTWRLVPYIY